MNSLTRTILSVIAGIIILFLAFSLARFFGQQKEPPKRKEDLAKKREVEVMKALNSTIPTTLEVQGELVAFNKIDIFAEVSGTLENTSRPFKVGSYFPKGSLLIKVDQSEAKLNLLAQKSTLLNSITQLMPDLKIDYPESFSNWKQYLDQYDVEKPLPDFPKPVNEQEKYFIASRNLFTQFYNIKSLEERLDKYAIYAPFGGVITQTSINPGALVRSGQKLGELMNTGSYELEVTVPLADLKYLQPGYKVKLYSEDIAGTWDGKVKRVNDQVESTSQAVKVFIDVSGKELREGMYMRGEIEGSSIENAMRIDRELLINQNSVYQVRDSVLELLPVQVVKITEGGAIIRGIKDGTPLLKALVPGAFEGMKVKATTNAAASSQSENLNQEAVGSLK